MRMYPQFAERIRQLQADFRDRIHRRRLEEKYRRLAVKEFERRAARQEAEYWKYLVWRNRCRARQAAFDERLLYSSPITLVIMPIIKSLSGFGFGQPHSRRDEFSDALRGKSGPHACGPHAWDNAIRALEDG